MTRDGDAKPPKPERMLRSLHSPAPSHLFL